MKRFNILATILLLPACFFSQKKATMSATVEYVQNYCGGARPTPEMEEAARVPKPYAMKKIILVSSSGYVDSVQTNSKGSVKKKVPVGKYKLYEAWRYYKTTPKAAPKSFFDSTCLELEWKKHFMEISVSKKKVIRTSENPIISGCDWDVPCMYEQHLPPRPE